VTTVVAPYLHRLGSALSLAAAPVALLLLFAVALAKLSAERVSPFLYFQF